MEQRKYYTHPFMQEFDTAIVEASSINNLQHIVLENTIFYPEGGGQPSDGGFINDQPVLDVYERDGKVFHVVASRISDVLVTCKLNWKRRFYHMQHHTGQHLMSAVFYRTYSFQTCGFHLGPDYATIDIGAKKPEDDLITEAELKINELIYQDRPINCYFPSQEQLDTMELRKQPAQGDNIRIVEIAGFDAVPCCGTHLKSSGQVGLVKILKTEKYKSLTRVYFACGKHAFQDFQHKHHILADLAKGFSASIEDVACRVETEMQNSRALAAKNKQLHGLLAHYQAEEAIQNILGKLVKMELGKVSDPDYAAALANEISRRVPCPTLITFNNRLVLACSSDLLDCGQFMREHLPHFRGRGGGSAQFAHACFPTQENMARFILQLETNF